MNSAPWAILKLLKKRVFWLEFFFHERCFSWHRLCGPRSPYRDLPPPPHPREGPRGSIEIATPSILQTQAGTRVFPQILCGEEMDDRFATFFELSNFPSASYLGRQCMHSVSISQQWRIQGRTRGPGPPLISKPN